MPLGPGAQSLERADVLYAAGEREPAAQAYRRHLERHPDGRNGDRVLFRLAALHLQPESPIHDPVSGLTYLDRLIRSRPNSPYAEPARLLRRLQLRVEALEEQSEQQKARLDALSERLEALKRIDLQRSGDPPPR